LINQQMLGRVAEKPASHRKVAVKPAPQGNEYLFVLHDFLVLNPDLARFLHCSKTG
jgi:hypothetical protein